MNSNKSIQKQVASYGRGGMPTPEKSDTRSTGGEERSEKDPQLQKPLEGAELFSLFTANIIKANQVFTR